MTAEQFIEALENARILFESGQMGEDEYLEFVEDVDNGQNFSDTQRQKIVLAVS